MIRTGLTIGAATIAAAIFAPPPFQGSDLARRVSAAPDGLVKMTYASRDGICGDGRSFIADAASSSREYDVWFAGGMSVTGSMGDLRARCEHGPVRLMLVVRDHRVIDVQPFVGPSSAATERPGTDLGSVSAPVASRYLLDLAAHGRPDDARNAILAASVADSVRVSPLLAAMARDKSLAGEARESALSWLGRVAPREGDRDALRVARTIAGDRDDQTDVRERAIRVIGEDDDGATYLRTLYSGLDEPTLRERVVRVIGERGTKADMDWVRDVALDRSQRTSVRERAVRVFGEASDSRALRELYVRLDEPALRERVIRAVAEIGDRESRQWLRDIVERPTEPSELRDRAVRSLAEAGVTTEELVSLYDSVSDRAVRDRLVNVLAERGDRTAREKLRSIATDDPDEDLRRRATRKLTDK